MKRLIFIGLVVLSVAGRADLLTDITTGVFRVKSLPSMTPMSDGEHYAILEEGNVLVCDYKTGTVTDTLFSTSTYKNTKEIGEVDGFVLSGDERYMLISCKSEKIFRRSTEAYWYIVDRHRREVRPLTEQMPVRNPVFSPNGRYIAFSRSNNLYVHKLDFGTEVAVTTDGKAGGVINGTADWLYEEEFTTTGEYSFSPDNKQLVFLRLDETEVPSFSWQTYLGESDGSESYRVVQPGYPENHEIRYPRAGEKNAKAQVVVYDMHYKSLKTMELPDEGDSYIPRIMWTGGVDQLAIFRLNRNQNKLEMFFANARSGVSKRIYTEENKTGYVDYELIDEWQFNEDNTILVVSESDGWRHAYLYNYNGQKLRQLTTGKFDLTQVYGYEASTQTLVYQAALPAAVDRQVFVLNGKKNKTTCLTPGSGVSGAMPSAGCKYLALSHTTLTEPTSYKLVTRDGKPVRDLLDNNDIAEKVAAAELPKQHLFSFVTERGDTLNGWIMLPKEAEGGQSQVSGSKLQVSGVKYPLLLFQYSGPASQQVLNRFKIDWEHYLVKEKGIVVACVDPRGTNSRGREFRNMTYMNIGQKEAEDQISAARYLASLGFIDSTRMAIWGWSYGGFQTLMTMSQSASPFRCGIAVAPVTDFRLYDSGYTERFMRRPQSNEFGYKACALPLMADKLEGRVLLVHGLADDNVHCQNMWQYVDALVQAGKQFEMQIYPDDNHFLRKRGNYRHLYVRMTEFIDRNLLSK